MTWVLVLDTRMTKGEMAKNNAENIKYFLHCLKKQCWCVAVNVVRMLMCCVFALGVQQLELRFELRVQLC